MLLAALAVVACVLLVGQLIAKRLTRSLVSLTEISGSVVHDGLSDSRAPTAGPQSLAEAACCQNKDDPAVPTVNSHAELYDVTFRAVVSPASSGSSCTMVSVNTVPHDNAPAGGP